MLRELCTYACAYTVASYSHALTRDHYWTSCTDVKRRVYETLQREQNGGSNWLGHGGKLITLLTFYRSSFRENAFLLL